MEGYRIAYEKGYRVNSKGEVFSKRGKVNAWITGGYYVFNIKYLGSRMNIKVHRLLGYQKYGQLLENKELEIRHLNGISTDNSYDNIGIGTHSQNMMDKPKRVRQQMAKNANKKYSDELIAEVRRQRVLGLTYRDLSIKFGMCKATLSYYLGSGKKHQVLF